MKEPKTIMIQNGDMLQSYRIFRCERCDCEIEEAWPRVSAGEGVYCGECALLEGLIDTEKYEKQFLFFIGRPKRVAIHDGEVCVMVGRGRFDWERPSKGRRKNPDQS